MLLIAAGLSFLVAALHVGAVFVGAPAYRYLGAGGAFARAAETGRAWPALVTTFIALAFVACGTYALSGAGLIRPLPYLRAVLVGIAAVYTLVACLVPVMAGGSFIPGKAALASQVEGVAPEGRAADRTVGSDIGLKHWDR